MKRIMCVFLSVLMVTSCALVFSSCALFERFGKKTAEVDVSDYKIVLAEGLSSVASSEATRMATYLRKMGNTKVRISTDSGSLSAGSEEPEILIGDTQREETLKAKKSIKGHGYTIQVVDHKIVIVGTTKLLTILATNYFIDEYLVGAEDKNPLLTMQKKTVFSDVEMQSLLSDGQLDYVLVYPDSVDDKPGESEFGSSPSGTAADYVYDAVSDVKSTLTKTLDLKASTVRLATDAAKAAELEITVGNVDRPEVKESLAGILPDQYGVFAKNGKLMITSWNNITLPDALSLFKVLLDDCKTEDGSYLFPADFAIKGDSTTNWVIDFPRPTGLTLSGTQDVANDSLEFYYEGEEVTPAAYHAYIKTLKENGYRIYTQSEAEDSVFATLVNDSTGVVLHTGYYAYKYVKDLQYDAGKNEQNIFKTFKPCIRIVSAPKTSVNLLKEDTLQADLSYTRLTDTRIASVKLNRSVGNFGMNYIIMLEDGTFLVYDGGGDGKTDKALDHVRMYKALQELFAQAHDGAAPSSQNPIVIRGWFLTHLHWDHITVFKDFCKDYVKESSSSYKDVVVEDFYANIASPTELYNCYNPNNWGTTGFDAFCRTYRITYRKCHTGQNFYLANAEVEVLYTHEDMYPNAINYYNDSSTIFRFNLRTTDGSGKIVGSSTSMVFLGDLHYRGSRFLCATYGSYMKSDMVQVAHHGYNGCEQQLYQLIAPSCVWWPTSKGEWNKQTGTVQSAWNLVVDFFVARRLASVKRIIVQDTYNACLTINKDGPQYDSVVDLIEHKTVKWELPYYATGDTGALVIR